MARPSREKRDAKGRITRTDHSTMGDVVREVLFGGAPRPLKERKKDVNKSVDDLTSLKKRQDEFAKVVRRS
jgi:hypothetical protein